MRVLMSLLMLFFMSALGAFAQGKINQAVYIKHTMAIFKDIDQMELNQPIKESNTYDAVYKQNNKEYSKVTNDPKIMKALDLLIGTIGESSRTSILGDNMSGKPMKIEFKDLSKISKAYKDFDALGWKEDGQLYIYINKKHQNSPPEAFSALLSHEALHQDEYNSFNEETYAWTMEAAVWTQLNKKNPDLAKLDPNEYSLVYREDTLGKMFKDGNNTDKLIRKQVESNPGYNDLPKRSPSFEDDN